MMSFSRGYRSATSPTFDKKFAASSATGRPARSAAGQSQSIVPSVGHDFMCSCKNVKRSPSMPGCFFHPSISPRLSGLSSGKLPRIAKRSGFAQAASMASALAFGSHEVGGWMTAASTPATAISFKTSSFVNAGIWRCRRLPGLPPDQMWTCASTIFIGLLYDRLIDEGAHQRVVVSAERRLLHRDDHQLLLGIGPPCRREGAVPGKVARRAGARRASAILAHGKPEAPRIAWAGVVLGPARDPREMVARHQLDGLGRQHPHAVQDSSIQEHLGEARVVDSSRDGATTAAVELPWHRRIRDFVVGARVGMLR